ncbi:MAG: hypothetical protein M1835_000153 [Candelina submexicana]|nr:MAG: hypothetical protein M1835_000153 [Candelina submexicana]
MATFLFPSSVSSSPSLKRNLYTAVLMDLIRGSSDAIDALKLFSDLVVMKCTNSDLPGFMAFDAHVGDTSCQLRAGMLLSLTSFHRNCSRAYAKPEKSPLGLWLDETLVALERLRTEAKKACSRLTEERVHPSELGFGERNDTVEGILSALGWSEPVSNFAPEPKFAQTQKDSKDTIVTVAEISPSTSQLEDPISCQRLESTRGLSEMYRLLTSALARLYRYSTSKVETQHSAPRMMSDYEKLFPSMTYKAAESDAHSPQRISSVIKVETSLSILTDIRAEPQESNGLLATTWDLHDSRVLVRFIVYTYILSKYKRFCRLQDVVGARIDLDAPGNYGFELVRNNLALSNINYKHPKIPGRTVIEVRNLQAWISNFSCAWLQAIASPAMTQSGLGRLLAKTTQKSPKNLTVMSTYVGYLLLRELWAKNRETIVLVSRRFCDQGFHNNFFLARLELIESDGEKCDDPSHTLGQHIVWRLQQVKPETLLNSQDQADPHIIGMGVSIDGSYLDYMAASSPTSSRTHTHDCHDCPNNLTHISDMVNADHDRLALAVFAHHKHYAFPLGKDINEADFVAEHMREEVPSLAEHWQKSVNESESLGTGTSLRVFKWQHILLESKARIVKRVVAQKDAMPVSADIPVFYPQD